MSHSSPHSPRRVAVIGGGLTGLACAGSLAERGVETIVLDKGRSAGGRLATRRVPPFTFDLGAQYFTVRSERFARLVDEWLRAGTCARWSGRVGAVAAPGEAPAPVEPSERFVGTPGMSALARHLARDLVVRTSTRVERIEPLRGRLRLYGTVGPTGSTLAPARERSGDELGEFDAVVIAIPPAQARALLGEVSPSLESIAAAAVMEPCLALGVALPEGEGPSQLPFDALFVGREDRHALSWVARDSSKPGRPRGEAWVAHASASWSAAHFGDAPEDATRALLAELAGVLGVGTLRPVATAYQRWAYARPGAESSDRAWVDADARIAVGGDWASGGRVEGAVESGWALAERLLELDAR